jgi:DNA-binding HxlR family transcriptional regulator
MDSCLQESGSFRDEEPNGARRSTWACSELLGRKWTSQIIGVLLAGPRRFSGLQAALPGLSDKVLSQRLSQLEGAGIVSRTQFLEIPPRVEYALTPPGLALRDVIGEMRRWSRTYALPADGNGARR